jgi:hypothetical protein
LFFIENLEYPLRSSLKNKFFKSPEEPIYEERKLKNISMHLASKDGNKDQTLLRII